MLPGIRNIAIVNTVLAILCVMNYYLPMSSEGWIEVSTALLVSSGTFLLSGPILLIRIWLIWHFVRVLCYVNALIFVLYFVSLVGKGYLLSLPLYTVLFLLFGFYFIGVRGYLSSDSVRVAYAIKIEVK